MHRSNPDATCHWRTSGRVPPNGGGKRKPMARFPAGLRIDDADGQIILQKVIAATGPRTLSAGLMGGFSLSEPLPVLGSGSLRAGIGGTQSMVEGVTPIEYDQRMEIDLHEQHNPIGVGLIEPNWQKKSGPSQFPAPQIEAFERPFTAAYAEIAARNAGAAWPKLLTVDRVRCRWSLVAAATQASPVSYDEVWKATRWPRLPRILTCVLECRAWGPADRLSGGRRTRQTGQSCAAGAFRRRQHGVPVADEPVETAAASRWGVPLFKRMNVDTVLFDLQAMRLSIIARCAVAAASGVDVIELGTWDVGAARKRNAEVLNPATLTPELVDGQ